MKPKIFQNKKFWILIALLFISGIFIQGRKVDAAAAGYCTCSPACNGDRCSSKSVNCGNVPCDLCCQDYYCSGDAECRSCTPNCSCAANTCIGQTCPDGCGGTCPGTKQCCTPNCSCANNTCEGETCPDGCGGECAGKKIPNCSCKYNTCVGEFCVDCDVVCAGVKTCCTPNCSCAANTCIGQTCPDGCGGTCAGTKQCCTPNCACAANTCIGQTCPDGCGGTCQGTKNCCTPNCSGKECGPDGCGGSCGSCPSGQSCQNGQCVNTSGCTPNCSCAANTCIGQTCSDGCGGLCEGTKNCCTPNCSCAANTCIGQTCSDGCGGTCQGKKICSGCNPGEERVCTINGCEGKQICQSDRNWGPCIKNDQNCAKSCEQEGKKCCQKAGSDNAYQSLDCPAGYYCTSGNCPEVQTCNSKSCDANGNCINSTFTWPKGYTCPSCTEGSCGMKKCKPKSCIDGACKESGYEIYIEESKSCSDFDACKPGDNCSSTKDCSVGQCSQIQVPDPKDPNKKQWIPICTITKIKIPSSNSCPISSCSTNADCGGGGDDGDNGGEEDKYSCNTSSGVCYTSTNGPYSSSSSCENKCKFRCNTTNWTCEFDQNGVYDDKNSCQSQCNADNLIINLLADPRQITQGVKTLLKVTYNVTNAKANSDCTGNSTDNFFWNNKKINVGPSGNKTGTDSKEVTLNQIKNYNIWLTCIDKNNNQKTATTTVEVVPPTPTTQPPTPTTQPPSPSKDCRIIEFSINGKTNRDKDPLIFWVNQVLNGKVSTNFDCLRCVVSSNDNWNETYDASNWNFQTSRTAISQFKISKAGDYSFTLTCYGEDPNDIEIDNLSLRNVKVYNLPFWHEIIPVLPGFLRGLFGVK